MNQIKNWSEQIGIGGHAGLTLTCGFLVWVFGRRGHPLVLRDEPTILSVPAAFVYVGLLFSVLVLLLFGIAIKAQKRTIRWGGASSRRGGPVQWVGIILACLVGVTAGTVGAALWINAALDRSVMRSHSTTITRTVIRGSNSRGGPSFFIEVADWQRPEQLVRLLVNCAFYLNCHAKQERTVRTRTGFLGYEWLAGIE